MKGVTFICVWLITILQTKLNVQKWEFHHLLLIKCNFYLDFPFLLILETSSSYYLVNSAEITWTLQAQNFINSGFELSELKSQNQSFKSFSSYFWGSGEHIVVHSIGGKGRLILDHLFTPASTEIECFLFGHCQHKLINVAAEVLGFTMMPDVQVHKALPLYLKFKGTYSLLASFLHASLASWSFL